MIAINAQSIVAARERGERPADPVFVLLGSSAVRRAYPTNAWVLVQPEWDVRRCDWSWCIGLDLEIVAESVVGNDNAVALAESIILARPRNLAMWETTTGRRWWLVDTVGQWPSPWPLAPDRRLVTEGAHATRA